MIFGGANFCVISQPFLRQMRRHIGMGSLFDCPKYESACNGITLRSIKTVDEPNICFEIDVYEYNKVPRLFPPFSGWIKVKSQIFPLSNLQPILLIVVSPARLIVQLIHPEFVVMSSHAKSPERLNLSRSIPSTIDEVTTFSFNVPCCKKTRMTP